MIKKSIVALVVIVAAAAMVFGASNYTHSAIDNSNPEQKDSSTDNNTRSNASDDSTNETKISPAKAQEIAQKYIEEPGTTAGTPKLIKTNGQYIYVVPVIDNGTTVGEINIDAINGKNVGGAGGAP